MSYAESKVKLDDIRSNNHLREREIIFRTAILYVVECGQQTFKNEDWLQKQVDDVHIRHDIAEFEGKHLMMTRDFEIEILKCAAKIAEINTMDLLMYLQREIWFGNDIDYKRAIDLLRGCLHYFISDTYEIEYALNEAYDAGFSDYEIEELGFGCMLDIEEEE